MSHSLDRLDLAILRLLSEEPRLGVREYARRLNVARATVQGRIHKLERSGVIRSWRPVLDPAAMGYPGLAYVKLYVAQGKLAQTLRGVEAIPEITEVTAITGEGDLMCLVVAPDSSELEQILHRIIAVEGVERTITEVALSWHVRPRITPLLDRLLERCKPRDPRE